MSTQKKLRVGKVELVFYIVFGLLALWGLVYIILGLFANFLPIAPDQNALKQASNSIKAMFGLDFFGWGLILFGVFGFATAMVAIISATTVDRDYEKAQRRAARLQRNKVVKEETPVVEENN